MARNRSLFEDCFSKNLAEYLSRSLGKKELGRLSRVSKSTQMLFSQPLTVLKLLQGVKNDDYDVVSPIIQLNPALMFQEAQVTHGDDTFEVISPLKLALKELNTSMWRVFFEKIKQTNNPNLMDLFSKQALSQKECVDIMPSLKLYLTFTREANRQQDDHSTDEQINLCFLNLVKLHREIIPWHMIKAFCGAPKSTFENLRDSLANSKSVDVMPFTSCTTYCLKDKSDQLDLKSSYLFRSSDNFVLLHGRHRDHVARFHFIPGMVIRSVDASRLLAELQRDRFILGLIYRARKDERYRLDLELEQIAESSLKLAK